MKIDPSILQGKGIESYTEGPSSGSATKAPTAARKPKRPAKKTVIHDAIWRAHGLPVPSHEYLFHWQRKWRFDYAWPNIVTAHILEGLGSTPRHVAVEIQGGLFSHGRHTRGAALAKEYEKLNEANLAGWCVLLVTPAQVKDGSAFELVRRALA